jgi:CDP-glucose 4,6-dehydratase
MAASPKEFDGTWNFGPEGSSIAKVQQVVELVITYWGSGSWKQADQIKQPHEAGLLALDISKAKSELGWRPCLTLAEAVEDTIEWYRAIRDRQDVPSICRAQIHEYMDRMHSR